MGITLKKSSNYMYYVLMIHLIKQYRYIHEIVQYSTYSNGTILQKKKKMLKNHKKIEISLVSKGRKVRMFDLIKKKHTLSHSRMRPNIVIMKYCIHCILHVVNLANQWHHCYMLMKYIYTRNSGRSAPLFLALWAPCRGPFGPPAVQYKSVLVL